MSEKITKKSPDYKKYALPTGIAIIFLAIGFGLGTLYQKNHFQSSFTSRGNQIEAGTGLGTRTGNRTASVGQGAGNGVGLKDGSGNSSIFGEITKMDDSSITVKTTDGSSKIILISDSTAITQSVDASKTDLSVGTQVKIDGTTDDNTGSVTSKSIEIDPSMVNQR